jgi:hypothetical protein
MTSKYKRCEEHPTTHNGKYGMDQHIYDIPDSTTCDNSEELNLTETNNWFHSNGHIVIMQEIPMSLSVFTN